MEDRPYCSQARKELGDHPLYPLSQTRLIEIQTEDILSGIEISEAGQILLCISDLQGGHDGLKLRQHGIG